MGRPIPDFGKFLEGLRGSMSLREAAKKSGLSHAYIRDLELERNRSTNDKITPSPDTLKKLSAAYGYSYTELMIKAGHLPGGDTDSQSNGNRLDMDLNHVYFIEIGRKDITYHTEGSNIVHSIDSLLDFSTFLDELEENDFKKMDTDLYVNLNHIRKYDERKGLLFFHEDGTGPRVTISAIRQKKYHDLIARKVAANTEKSLEFSFGKSGNTPTFSAANKHI
ncbi:MULTISPECIES: helix-turn-helix domain-containing protein [Paenibacillus]|uniref:Xre family transcriptional regulator n=1 Tax=Paenibacillus naphthalenovorans TaxID=162209 RepID=A0A0U2ILK2_9BACL|nr:MULTISPECIES: helix-turn-helix transcriptional regulator [Paenibacillus]ALS20955.1 Xre family transcriptional regulator [Paenibacillus naphthalenovorans]NTZ18816.1 XRE family transcriptional regulator [Paenibacillus sp. JMULE4]GCL70987.1 XRE family transcriptional regulator [Paenibacillus naphthalenovorans]